MSKQLEEKFEEIIHFKNVKNVKM